jgi:hypothetical protein
MLRRRDATSCQITILEDGSQVRLTVTCDGSPRGRDDAEAGDDLAAVLRLVTTAGGQSDCTEEGGRFRLRVELPGGEPALK